MRLLHRYMLNALLPLVLMVSMSAMLVTHLQNKALREALIRGDSLHAELHANEISAFFSTRIAEIEAMASAPIARSGVIDALLPYLEREQQRLTYQYESLTFMAVDGKVYNTSGKVFDVSDRYYFPQFRAAEIVVSKIIKSRDTGKPIVLLLVPVFSEAGQHLGAVTATVLVSTLESLLLEGREPEESAFLVDGANTRIGSGSLAADGERLLQEIGNGIVTRQGKQITFAVGDNEYFAYAVPLGISTWTLLHVIDADVSLRPIRVFRQLELVAFLLAVTAAIILSFILSRRSIRPIQNLLLALRAVAAGDLSARAVPAGAMELKELAASFNEMTSTLEQREKEHRQAEATERGYREIFNSVRDAIFVLDFTSGRAIDANKRALDLLHCERDQIVDRTIGEFCSGVPPFSRAQAHTFFSKAIEDGETAFEWNGVKASGEQFWCYFSLRNMHIRGERCVLAVATDITDSKRDRESLEQKEQRFRSFVQHTTDAVWCLEFGEGIPVVTATDLQAVEILDGVVVECNDKFLSHFSFSEADSVIGKRFAEVIHAPIEKLLPSMRTFVQQGYHVRDLELTEILPSGTMRFTQSNAYGIVENGNLVRMWNTARDVTQQKLAERAQRESDERRSLVIAGSNDGIWDWNIITGAVVYSDRLKSFLGYHEHDSSFGSDISFFTSLLHPDDVEATWSAIQQHLNEQELVDVDCRMRRADGVYRWFRLRGQAMWDERGRPTRMAGSLRDITDRLRAQKEVEERERRFRRLFEQSVDGIVIFRENRFLMVNPAFSQLVGYSVDELTRETFNHVDLVVEEDRERLLGYLNASTSREETNADSLVFRSIARDKTEYVFELRAFPVEWDEGPALIGVVRDITNRLALEDQMRQVQKMEVIGRLAGGIAHDFNNLLTAMTGHAELASLRLDSTDPSYHDVQQVLKTADRAAALTRQLLTFSRRHINKPVVLDVNEVIRDMATMLRRTIGEDVQLHLALSEQSQLIAADRSQLEQVVLNLLVNARDAMPNGGNVYLETLSAKVSQSEAQQLNCSAGDYFLIRFRDEGSGIPENLLGKVFEPFFSTKQDGQGAGLGLSTVFGIVMQHKGAIKVESEPGTGSTFSVYFAVTNQPKSEDLNTHEHTSLILTGNETVLVVEDEAYVRDTTVRSLEHFGYQVKQASCASEALDMLSSPDHGIDLVITDVVMPAMSGGLLIRQLTSRQPRVPCICMSGYTEDTSEHPKDIAPDIPFVEKPFAPHTLAQIVRRVLDNVPGRSTEANKT